MKTKKFKLGGILDTLSQLGIASGDPIAMGVGGGLKLLSTLAQKDEPIDNTANTLMMKDLTNLGATQFGQFNSTNSVYRAMGGPLNGGSMIKLSKDGGMMVGRNHSEGGIDIEGVGEVEGGESITKSGGMPYAASKRIDNPLTGRPIAEDIALHEMMKGKFEKMKGDPFSNNAKDRHQSHIDNLIAYQESVNGNQEGQPKYGLGGMLSNLPVNSITAAITNKLYDGPPKPMLQGYANFGKISNDSALVDINREGQGALGMIRGASQQGNSAMIGNLAAQIAREKSMSNERTATANNQIYQNQESLNTNIRASNNERLNGYQDEKVKYHNQLIANMSNAVGRDVAIGSERKNSKTELQSYLLGADPKTLEYLGIKMDDDAKKKLMKKLFGGSGIKFGK